MTTESPIPSFEEYAKALSAIEGQITDPQRAMLVGHCAAPEQTLTAGELAKLGGYDGFETANIQYGRLGHLVAEVLEFTPKPRADGTPIWTRTIAFDSEQRSREDRFQWTLRPEVAMAFRVLGWYSGDMSPFAGAEEVHAPKRVNEGAGVNPATLANARQQTIARMAMTVRQTVESATGQQVNRTVKVKELYFSGTPELEAHISTLLEDQEGLCAITGLRLQLDQECGDPELMCSLDRIDSNRHYEPGNLQVVCRFVNRWKSDSTDSEFRRLIALVRGKVD